jgi:hypothetical protein
MPDTCQTIELGKSSEPGVVVFSLIPLLDEAAIAASNNTPPIAKKNS